MRLHLNESDAGRLSFPDRGVRRFIVTPQRLALTVDGVFIDGIGLVDGLCEVELITKDAIVARTYHGDRWMCAEEAEAGLRDICEWAVDGADLKVSGFHASSGVWTEFVVPAFSATILAG
jgi:hypothetical protein